MDSFDIKVEKANAILRYKRLKNITALFRFMEVCMFLFIISKLSAQLPLAFKLSGECIRGLSITIFSPGFLFILGNAIVLVLFLKSGQVSAQETKDSNHTIEFCKEYVESCGKGMDLDHVEEVKKQSKKQGKKQGNCVEKEALLDFCSFEDRKMVRSNSEDLKRYQNQDSSRKLRRTVTENGRKVENYGERSKDGLVQRTCDPISAQNFSPRCYAADEMSSEEFRRTVEDFIARQQRSLREEFSSIVTFGS